MRAVAVRATTALYELAAHLGHSLKTIYSGAELSNPAGPEKSSGGMLGADTADGLISPHPPLQGHSSLRAMVGDLEVELQAELELSRLIIGFGYDPKVRALQTCDRHVPDRSICRVEHLKAKLETESLSKWELAKQR